MDPVTGLFLNQPYLPQEYQDPIIPQNDSYFEDQKPDVAQLNGMMELNETSEDLKPAKKRRKRKPPNLINTEQNIEGISFYACSVCDIKYNSMKELQTHILKHKDRVTSWDLKIKRQKIRKKKLKEMKKKKKLKLKDLDKPVDEIQIKEEVVDPEYKDLSTNLDCNSCVNNNINNVNNSVGDNKTNDSKQVEESKKNEEANNLEKIFKCGLCSKQFTLGYYLKLHIRSHTGEKPYQCAECGLSFITASKLGRHRKKTHLSIRFECRICHRPYTRLEFLTRHFNKQHAEDKIEGEPYDYNAILPYLKELQEELERKKAEEAREKQSKSEIDDIFSNELKRDGDMFGSESKRDGDIFGSELKRDGDDYKDTVKEEDKPKIEDVEMVVAERIFADVKVKERKSRKAIKKEIVEVKCEPEDFDLPDDEPLCFVPVDDADFDQPEDLEPLKSLQLKKEEGRDEDTGDRTEHVRDVGNSSSDEDYFPANTWLQTTEDVETPKRSSKQYRASQIIDCEHCGKKIKGSYMRTHLRTHTHERPYKCVTCNKSFITASKRNRHAWTHLKKDENGVLIGGDEVKEERDGDDDEGKSPKKPKRRKRKQKDVDVNPEPVEPERTVRKRTLACQYCNKKFVHKEALQVHELTHDGESKQPICQFCLAEFDDDISLQLHEGTHSGPSKYLCTICGKSYKKKETMVYHRRSHVNCNRFQCDACPSSFDALCKLRRHLLRHREVKYASKYECPVCAHIFHTKYHIQKHLVVHEKEGLIGPDNRGDVLAMVLQNVRRVPLEPDGPTTNLKELIPTEERSRVCNICGEVFQHFYLLETHLKAHGSHILDDDAAERKYVCQVCNKGFKLHYYLKLHSFTHTKEKPFVCSQCGKGFITKGKLKRHMETHAGLKKYQCPVCLKFFTRPSYLRIHVRTIHPNTQDYSKLQVEWGADTMHVLHM